MSQTNRKKSQRRRQKKWHPLVRILFGFGLLLLASMAGLAGWAFWYVHKQGGLTTLLETQISRPDAGFTVTIGRVGWALESSATPLVISLHDVDITAGINQFQVPQSSMYFGAASALNGGQPEKLIVKGLQMQLTQNDGRWGLQDTGLGLQTAFDMRQLDFDYLAAQWQNLAPYISLRQIYLQAESVSLDDAALPDKAPLTFEDVHLFVDTADVSQVKLQLSGKQKQDQEKAGTPKADKAGRLTALIEGNLLSRYWQARVSGNQILAAPIAAYFPVEQLIFNPASALSGQFMAQFDGDLLQLAQMDMDISQADLPLAILSQGRGRFEKLGLSAAYSHEDNLITITRGELELADKRRLSVNGQLLNVNGNDIDYSGTILAEDVSVASILADWPENRASEIKEQLDALLSAGKFASLLLTVDGNYLRDSQSLQIAELAVKGDFSSVRLNASYKQYRSVIGTLSGAVDINVGSGGKVRSAELEANFENGYMVVDGFDGPLTLAKAGLKARYEPGTLFFQNMFADFGAYGGLNANAAADIRLGDTPDIRVSAAFSTDQMDVGLFQALWPDAVAKPTFDWIRKRFDGGQLADVNLRLEAEKKGAARPRVTAMTGQGRLLDTHFSWRDDSPVLRNIDAELTMANNQFDITLNAAYIDALSMDRGAVSITPLIAPKGTERQVAVSFSGAGSVDEIRTILGHPSVNRLPAALETLDVGQAQANAAVKFRSVLANRRLQTNYLRVDGLITASSIGNIPQINSLDDSELVITVVDDDITLDGIGLVRDVPVQFTLNTDKSRALDVRANLAPSGLLQQLLPDDAPIMLSGETGAKINLNYNPDTSDLRLDIDADMTNAAVHIPALNFAKFTGEVGQMALVLQIENNQLKALEAIDLELGSLTAKGRLIFGQNNQIQGGYFDQITLPGNDIQALVLERLDGGAVKISANAKRADISPFLREAGNGQSSLQLEFDITADRLQISDVVGVSGHLTGQVDGAGKGEAQLRGDILTNGRALITEATVNAMLGADVPVINAVGLIGGAEARMSFAPSENDLPVLILQSTNGGRVLKGLGITDTIRGGRISLVNQFVSADLRDFDTTIELEEFNVIEAPAAVRAFSVLSISGLYSLVEGDGTRFTQGEARVRVRDGRYNIERLRASGGAVGVSMVGSYDRKSREVEVSGNLVPVNQFSKIIGAVPLVGELLTGLDKSGIFATQFSLSGSIDDPEVNVNVASVAPGFLRDIFSPNWLGSEEERILNGDDAPSEDSTDAEAGTETDTSADINTDIDTGPQDPSDN